jgi:Methyltransferase domain
MPDSRSIVSAGMNHGAAAVVPLVDRIETAVKEIPGWTPIDQLCVLSTLGLATASLPGDFVEIGSWCGRSAVVLGLGAKFIGGTKVHCVDLFPERQDWHRCPDGTYDFAVEIAGQRHQACKQITMWADVFEQQVCPVYETYGSPLLCLKRQLGRFDLTSTVSIHRGTSATWAAAVDPTFRCKLAFVDGDHDYDEVCKDIGVLKDKLVPGGWICFDDAFSCYGGVDAAIRDLILPDPDFDLAQQMTRKFFVARKRIARV